MKKILSYLFVLALFIPAPGYSLLQGIEEGKIIKAEKDKVEINWGTEDGIVEGVKMNVYRKIDIVHPVTGEKYGQGKDIIGVIEIINSSRNYSVANIVSSLKLFKQGDFVEIAFVQSDIESKGVFTEKGVVTNVQGMRIIFDLGSNDGVEQDLIFDVIRQQPSQIHPTTGELMAGRQIRIGKINTISVEKDRSMGEILSSTQGIEIGDLLELSSIQKGDIEFEQSLTKLQPAQKERDRITNRPSDSNILDDQIVRGIVTRIDGNDVYFMWDNGYHYEAGKTFGIYKLEKIIHPISKKEIGDKLIQIAKINLTESKNNGGKGRIITRDSRINIRDLVGLLTEEEKPVQNASAMKPVEQKTEPSEERKQTSKTQQAKSVANEINQIQAEIQSLKNLSRRINGIERNLREQKQITEKLEKQVDLILQAVAPEMKDGKQITLVDGKATSEIYQPAGQNTNTLSIKYSDDMNVKFQVADKTLLVSLEADSLKINEISNTGGPEASQRIADDRSEGVKPEMVSQDESEGAQTSLIDKVPFFKNKLLLIGIAGGLLLIAGALFFLIKVKKGKSAGIPEDEDEEMDEEMEEEEEEDELSDEEDELAEDEEEIFDEELE